MPALLWCTCAFALVGAAIVAAAVRKAFRAKSAPFSLSASQDAGLKVETDFVGAGLLAGLCIFLTAGWFVWKIHDDKIDEMQRKIDNLTEFADQVKVIDFKAKLVFPADVRDATSIAQVTVSHQHLSDVVTADVKTDAGFNPNERTVWIEGLHRGDSVSIRATRILPDQSVRIYQSKLIEIPNVVIELSKMP